MNILIILYAPFPTQVFRCDFARSTRVPLRARLSRRHIRRPQRIFAALLFIAGRIIERRRCKTDKRRTVYIGHYLTCERVLKRFAVYAPDIESDDRIVTAEIFVRSFYGIYLSGGKRRFGQSKLAV